MLMSLGRALTTITTLSCITQATFSQRIHVRPWQEQPIENLGQNGKRASFLDFRSIRPRSQPPADSLPRNYLESLEKRDDSSSLDTNLDGSKFLWLPQDTYAGQSFFDKMNFFEWEDPTQGLVTYVNRDQTFARNLTYVQPDGTVVMQADMTSTLPLGQNRTSVRVESQANYTGGLFILDVKRAPWGCGVWPAFWTTNSNWPHDGEIDIIEGVHDNEHNQVTWHTDPGCSLDASQNFTGTLVIPPVNGSVTCDANINGNAGCGVTEWSRASYGPYFESQGGGVIAMKWDENGIAVWSFYRAAIPQDVLAGTPNPSTWGLPSAILGNHMCNITQYFQQHVIIFDITFCGVWAGNSYATTDCPGTCPEQLMNPANFVNATWHINSLKVYKKQPIYATVSSASRLQWISAPTVAMLMLLFSGLAFTW